MIEPMLAAQQINLPPGRAERIELAVKAMLEAVRNETPALDFDTDAMSHARAMERCRA